MVTWFVEDVDGATGGDGRGRRRWRVRLEMDDDNGAGRPSRWAIYTSRGALVLNHRRLRTAPSYCGGGC
jgi:hypothetical protein